MALKGTITKTLTGRKYTIEWSATQDIANNTSTITCVHKLTNDKTYSLYINSRTNSCTVGGDTKSYTSSSISTSGGSTITLGTTTHKVSHDGDGKKSVTISGTFNIQATLSGTYFASITASETVTLDTIPRSSSFSLSKTSLNVGEAITATITRANTGFTHIVEFYINSSYYQKYTSVATSQAFTIPTTWYNAMPSDTSCTAYCQVTTYNGATQVGDAIKKSFTVNVPTTIIPSIPNAPTVDPVNITTVDGTSRNILVKGNNKVTISISGCTAGSGSSIKSYKFDVLSGSNVIDTQTVTKTSVTFGPFSHTGDLKFRVTVTDKRDRSVSNSGSEPTCTCYDYTTPKFSSFTAFRCDSNGNADDSGTNIKYSFTVAYSNVNSTNKSTVRIFYRKGTSGSWTEAANAITNSTTKTESAIISNSNGTKITFGNESTYSVYAIVKDNYSSSVNSSTVTIFGTSRVLNVRKDGTGIAFGKMSETSNLFECKWPASFNNGLTLGISSQDTPPTNGIAVHDIRNASITPDSLGDKNANFYFDQISDKWHSVLHVKGWKDDHAAWELAGNAHNAVEDKACKSLKYRQGRGDTWQDWQTILTDKNFNDYISIDQGSYLPLEGGTLSGKLTLGSNLYYNSSTAGIDCSNSDIINANGIYFADASDSAGEAINFYRKSGYWDTLYAQDGVLKFHANRSTSTALGGNRVYDSSYLQFRRGTVTLSSSSAVTASFSSALSGVPTVMLTPLTTSTGVIPGKVTNVTSSGFSAIIGGSAVSSAQFAYLAIYYG